MNVEEIRRKYGDELATRIQEEIETANDIGVHYEIVEEQMYCLDNKIYFATTAYTLIFYVKYKTYEIYKETEVSYNDCYNALKIMSSIEKEEQQAKAYC